VVTKTAIEKRKKKISTLTQKNAKIVLRLEELRSDQAGMRQWIEHASVSDKVMDTFRRTLKGMSKEIAKLTKQRAEIEHRLSELERAVHLL
jgi:chaperonin cofactor prefoldin